MRKLIILEYPPNLENEVNRSLDTLALSGVKIVSGAAASQTEAHILPHFHYLCTCGLSKVTALSHIPACPKCGNKFLDVSPDGVLTANVYIPSFIKGDLTP